ncbi:MAG: DUF3565 domain-containing protein [Gammaproteobacteria bacterium]
MKRAIRRFNRDERDDWVAELECGHSRHVRHKPPWQNRPWVITEEGRSKMIGKQIECGWCERLKDQAPSIRTV